jgi:hypothetical protein
MTDAATIAHIFRPVLDTPVVYNFSPIVAYASQHFDAGIFKARAIVVVFVAHQNGSDDPKTDRLFVTVFVDQGPLCEATLTDDVFCAKIPPNLLRQFVVTVLTSPMVVASLCKAMIITPGLSEAALHPTFGSEFLLNQGTCAVKGMIPEGAQTMYTELAAKLDAEEIRRR